LKIKLARIGQEHDDLPEAVQGTELLKDLTYQFYVLQFWVGISIAIGWKPLAIAGVIRARNSGGITGLRT